MILPLLGGCNGLFYHPTPDIAVFPKKLNYSYEDLTFKSRDGTLLNGWFIPGRGTIRGTVLFYHGNAENIGNHYGAVYWLPDEGYNVFIFDYRGYGRSGGSPSREGIQEDGEAALSFLLERNGSGHLPIIVYGQSLGSAIAVTSVVRQKATGIAAVILESSFTSYRGITREQLGSFWLTWPVQWPLSYLVSNEYSPIDVIDQISPVPLLIVHGNADEIVPFHHSEELFRAAKEPKTLWVIPGGHHIEAFSPRHKENRKELIRFLGEILDKRLPPEPRESDATGGEGHFSAQ